MKEDSIPLFLYEMLEKQYGMEITNNILDGYKTNRYVTLRVNTIKTTAEIIINILKNEEIDFEIAPFSRNAFIIKNANKQRLQELSIYKNGEIYLQSLSSMLPPIILQPNKNENILDMTAAPGGKTTQIAAITENESYITACEMNTMRLERLKYNIEKQGAKGVLIMNKDARNLDDMFSFDRILLDAPCSGSGTLNISDKDIGKYFTKNLIEKSIKSQTELIKKAIKLLKVGHEMVYSTCSILKCENEEIIKNVLKEGKIEIVPIEIDNINDIPKLNTDIQGTLCVCPNNLYEGFFVAKLRRIK